MRSAYVSEDKSDNFYWSKEIFDKALYLPTCVLERH